MNARVLLRLAVQNPRQAMAMLREEEHRQHMQQMADKHAQVAFKMVKRKSDVRH